MGVSEMLFVGGFTVLCIGASVVVCKMTIMDMQEKLKRADRDIYYWKEQVDEEIYLRNSWHYQAERWKAQCKKENNDNIKLRRYIAELQKHKQTPNLEGREKDIMVKALKKAMFEAHPDRGGNSEDFIEINQLYKKLK